MNIKFQRRLDRFLGVPVCAALSVFERLRRGPEAAAPPRKILVILLSEMGSLVLAAPMFSRLKQRYPGASLHILVFARNRDVLDILPLVSARNVLTLDDRSLATFAAGLFGVLRAVRALAIDTAIDCELFSRASSILSWLSGARVRVGFHPHTQEGLYRGSFINRAVTYNPYRHLSQQFLTMVDAIESAAVPAAKQVPFPDADERPATTLKSDEVRQAAARLHEDFPAIERRKLVLVSPGGGILPLRAWPLDYYCRLCESLLEDGHAVGIVGLDRDKSVGAAIAAHCRSRYCVDLTGYTRSLRHLVALYNRASLIVANDGGPAQFAALTPVPTLVFFGPETPVLYKPIGKNVHCFHLSLPCSPCLTAYNHRASPCDGDNQCLKQISPDRVLAKAREILGTRVTVRFPIGASA